MNEWMNEWMKVVATIMVFAMFLTFAAFFDIRGMACRLRGVRVEPARPDANVRNSLEKWEIQT